MPVVPTAAPSVEDVLAGYWTHAERHYRLPDGSPSEGLVNIRAAMRSVRRLFAHPKNPSIPR